MRKPLYRAEKNKFESIAAGVIIGDVEHDKGAAFVEIELQRTHGSCTMDILSIRMETERIGLMVYVSRKASIWAAIEVKKLKFGYK